MKFFYSIFFLIFSSQAQGFSLVVYNYPECKMTEYLQELDEAEINDDVAWKVNYFHISESRTEEEVKRWSDDARKYSRCIKSWIKKAEYDRDNIQLLINTIDATAPDSKVKELIDFSKGNIKFYPYYSCKTLSKPVANLSENNTLQAAIYSEIVILYNESVRQYNTCRRDFLNSTYDDYDEIKKVQFRVWNSFKKRILEKRN